MPANRVPEHVCNSCLVVALALSSTTLLGVQKVLAQAIPDNTLNSQVNVNGINTSILGGTPVGNALFHSFEEFSIPTGHRFSFIVPEPVVIFNRVTGSLPSNINGTLRVANILDAAGSADIFLMNPNGILFGPNVNLDIRGSFVATTASSIDFADGSEFSAVNPTNILPVTIDATVPVGLRFGSTDPALIVNDGNNVGLGVNGDGHLTFVGGSIIIAGVTVAEENNPTDFNNEASLIATGALNGSGIVEVSLDGEYIGLTGNISDEVTPIISPETFLAPTFSSPNLSVNDQSQIVIEDSNIPVNAGDVIIYRSSVLTDGRIVLEANTINLEATNNVAVYGDNNSDTLEILARSNLNVSAARDVIIQEARLNTELDGSDGQESLIISGNNITLINNGELIGGAGDPIRFRAENGDIILNDSNIVTAPLGSTPGSNIILDAAEEISLVNSQVFGLNQGTELTEAVGDSGDIIIRAGSLRVENSQDDNAILTFVDGDGDGGDIDIQTVDSISFSGTAGIRTNGSPDGGEPSNVRIESHEGDISFSNGASIYTSTLTEDNGQISNEDLQNSLGATNEPGKVTVIARNGTVSLKDGAQIRTDTLGVNDAGDILIEAENIELGSVSFLTANTLDEGDGGNITITATEDVSISGNGTFIDDAGNERPIRTTLDANASSSGAGGSINVTGGNSITISDQAVLTASTSGTGAGGSINLNVPENLSDGDSLATPGVSPTGQNVTLSSGAEINAGTSGPGVGGSVQLGASDRLLVQDSSVTVASTGVEEVNPGDAGTLITNSGYVQLDDGDLLATSAASNGGNIDMTVDQILLLRNRSRVSAVSSGPESQDGNININAGGIVGIPQEDSDIIARSSRRGNVEIDAGAIVGVAINQGTELTPSSEILSTGETVLNLGVDPSQGTQELDQEPEDVALAEGCDTSGGEGVAEYYEIGTGGQAAGPDDSLGSGTLEEDWVQLEPQVAWDQLGEVRVSYPENHEQQAEQVAQYPSSCH